MQSIKTLPKKNLAQYQEILDRLICPVCQHKVTFESDSVSCTNIDCGSHFPIIDNIPILIHEAESIFRISDYTSTSRNNVSSIEKVKDTLKFFKPYLPSLSNNLSSKKNFKLLEKLLSEKKDPKILIIGGAEITTDTEMIFNSKNIIIESDVYIGPRTQVIIDSHYIPFENETFDLVIFQTVLEYVGDPYQCVQEAHRVLNAEGIVFSSTPFMQQTINGLVDYTRFTHLGHRRLFRTFSEIDSGIFAGTGVALGWFIRTFVGSIFDNKYLKLMLQVLVSFMFFWLKYIDYIISRNQGSYEGASGFYFIGRKSDAILSDKELIRIVKKK